MGKRRIALVFPDHRLIGGVTRVAAYLQRVARESEEFEVVPISLATSSGDRSSSRVRAPHTWFAGPQATQESWDGNAIWHVGTFFSELEFMRYRSRPPLSELLAQADLIQVVGGSPAWALPCVGLGRPVLLQAASMAVWERGRLLAEKSNPVTRWRRSMTRITDRLDRSALASIDWFFAENARMLRMGEQMARKDARVLLAPPGVDVHRFKPDRYRRDGYILSVGRFSDPRKRFDLLVRAYAVARNRAVDLPTLVLVGESPSSSQAELVDQLGLMRCVLMRGVASEAELAGVYRAAGMFVCASDEEGLGLAIIEAMACGVPVVATRSVGAEESVEDGVSGLLTRVTDVEDLADAMVRLHKDVRLREAMSRAARDRAVERFSDETTRSAYLTAYDEACAR
jgi:glycosyltransferase involved in cell wall biosynthesis